MIRKLKLVLHVICLCLNRKQESLAMMNYQIQQMVHQMEKLNKIPIHITFQYSNVIKMMQNMTFAKQLEAQKERYLRIKRKECNSSNNTKAKRKQSCAETSKCTENANSETLALMLTESISFKRKPICQVTL